MIDEGKYLTKKIANNNVIVNIAFNYLISTQLYDLYVTMLQLSQFKIKYLSLSLFV